MTKNLWHAAFLFLILFSFPSLAQESYTYSPEGCDFKATFPSEPGFVQRCPSNPDLPCYRTAQFTDRGGEAGGMINIEMTCEVFTDDVYETYTQENMEQLVLQMTQDANLPEQPSITYQEEENGLKISGTSGLKTSGYATKIFVTQVWVMPNSIMSIEGEMDLEGGEETDAKFADILRSITLVNPPEQISQEDTAN